MTAVLLGAAALYAFLFYPIDEAIKCPCRVAPRRTWRVTSRLTGLVEEVLVVTGTEHMGDVVGLLGSGAAIGCQMTYRVQDEAGGIAQALALAENFCHGEPMCVILGDNIFEDSLAGPIEAYERQGGGARILLKEVEDPSRFGVAEIAGEKIVGIEEKPTEPKSSLAVCGIYFFDATVFDVIRTLEPSGRGELEISDVNNAYVREGKMGYDFLTGWWTDAGTFESLKLAQEIVGSEQGRLLK